MNCELKDVGAHLIESCLFGYGNFNVGAQYIEPLLPAFGVKISALLIQPQSTHPFSRFAK